MVSVAESVGFGAASRRTGPSNAEINALPGDEHWYTRISPKPRDGRPLRARVFHPGGWATFDSPEDATAHLNHPTGTAEAARVYLEWSGRADYASFRDKRR